MRRLTIIIDSREQKPFEFPRYQVLVRKLKIGDYSVLGLETRICVERKSFNDLFGTYTKGRERFLRQLKLMSKIDRSYLVVECSVADVMAGHPRTVVRGPLLFEMVLETCRAFGVIPLFCSDRGAARDVTEFLLERTRMRPRAIKGGPNNAMSRRNKQVYGES
ncbi:MAG: ERCC4 domain-containing protein [Acidimicrobiia bacterium]